MNEHLTYVSEYTENDAAAHSLIQFFEFEKSTRYSRLRFVAAAAIGGFTDNSRSICV